ncbi:MAG TPA: GNAT family N-acetyltransferase, partial [Polyangiaceae bacterium]
MLVNQAQCFGAFTAAGECIAFNSIRTLPHPVAKNIKLAHRLVVLPDYQGLGVGWKLNEWTGAY